MLRITVLASIFALALSAEEIWRNVFQSIDPNHDNIVARSEFEKAIQGFDLNGDGKVPNAEFMGVWRSTTSGNHHQGATDAAGEIIFKKADANHDGNLSPSELNSIFAFVDPDGNGKSTPDEFKNAWSSIHSHEGHPVG